MSVERSLEAESTSLFPTQPWRVYPFLFIRWSTVQTQLKVSSVPVSRSMRGPSSQIHMYAFLHMSSSITHPCRHGQPVIHRPLLSHGAQERKGEDKSEWREEEDGAGWSAETVWNYNRTTPTSWKYHQNLLSFGMHGWIPTEDLQPVARVFSLSPLFSSSLSQNTFRGGKMSSRQFSNSLKNQIKPCAYDSLTAELKWEESIQQEEMSQGEMMGS